MKATLTPPRSWRGGSRAAADGGGAPQAAPPAARPLRHAFGAPPPRPGEDVTPLRFQIGPRTLLAVPRRLHRLALSLDQALAGETPALRPLAPGEDGHLVTSLPAHLETLLAAEHPRLLTHLRQRYHRRWIDLAAGEAAWRAGLSANARAQLRRKAKKLGPHRIDRFRTPAEVAAFHARASSLSARTYQAQLLDAGLPADPAALLRQAAADSVRAWLLWVDDQPIAYLCCTANGDTLRYDHVGHDPAWAAQSPGAVLQGAALADLFADRFARFDFTEGDGQHKRQLATGAVACVDLLLLRPSLANRALIAALKAWDKAVAAGKRWAPGLKRFAR